MKIHEIKELLSAKLLYGEELLSTDVYSACASDMMSDVLAFVKDQGVLLTGLVNPQVIRTADMMDMRCVVLVRGKKAKQAHNGTPTLSIATSRLDGPRPATKDW